MSYELSNGPIPAGMHVLHRCDVPLCVRPSHLFLGSNYDNIRDRMRKGRSSHKGAAGVRNTKAKLTPIEVLEIKALCDAIAMPRWKIGEHYGVSASAIHHIASGRNWRCLNE